MPVCLNFRDPASLINKSWSERAPLTLQKLQTVRDNNAYMINGTNILRFLSKGFKAEEDIIMGNNLAVMPWSSFALELYNLKYIKW